MKLHFIKVYQVPGTGSPEWNATIINVICYSCCFSAWTSQNVCYEKGWFSEWVFITDKKRTGLYVRWKADLSKISLRSFRNSDCIILFVHQRELTAWFLHISITILPKHSFYSYIMSLCSRTNIDWQKGDFLKLSNVKQRREKSVLVGLLLHYLT